MSVPPASAGGTLLIQLLQILETFDLVRSGAGAARLWLEALRLVGADRARHLGDSDFVAAPLDRLASKAYARSQAARIHPGSMASGGPGDPWRHTSGSTTHLSVLDRAGNMVALTKTINDFFGCGVTVPGTGILLNDDMDDFSLQPDSPNAIAPGKRPLSSMSPTLVLDPAGRPWMTLGTPGGPRIVATTAQIIANCVDFGMPIGAAINAPRLFLGEAGELEAEGRLPAAVGAEMRRLGQRVVLRDDWDLYFGGAQAAVYDHERGIITGAADPRRDGQAAAF
jgi:gamma-glutamyltranspeptidase/glutathione hydrolase